MFLGVRIDCGGGVVEYASPAPIVEKEEAMILEFLSEVQEQTGVNLWYRYNGEEAKVYFGSDSCVVEWLFSDGTASTTCQREKPILGCTNQGAINYDSSATANDGTCTY